MVWTVATLCFTECKNILTGSFSSAEAHALRNLQPGGDCVGQGKKFSCRTSDCLSVNIVHIVDYGR